jgi:hypothetical protein
VIRTEDPADREARALTAYLTGRPPTDYVLTCYRRAHAGATAGADPLDRALLRAACASRPLAALADAYGRIARPAGGLRRRITLLLAVLENAPETHRDIQSVPPTSLTAGLVHLGLDLAVGGATLGAALLCFGPVHLALRLGAGRRRERSA